MKGFLFFGSSFFHSKNPEAGMRHRRFFEGFSIGGRFRDRFASSIDDRNASDLGEILGEEKDEAPANLPRSRSPVSRLWRTMGCMEVGATL